VPGGKPTTWRTLHLSLSLTHTHNAERDRESHTHKLSILIYSIRTCKTCIVPSMLNKTHTHTPANHIQPLLLHAAHLVWRPLCRWEGCVCVCVCVRERVCVYGSVRCTAERKLVLIYWCQAGATSYCCCLKATPAWEFKPRERTREREIVDKCIQIPAVTSWAPFAAVICLLLFYIPALPMMLWFFLQWIFHVGLRTSGKP